MVKKINELVNPPKDPNSPESQEFLKELHAKIIEGTKKLKDLIMQWKEEDRRNEIK